MPADPIIHVLIGNAAWSKRAAAQIIARFAAKDDLLNPVVLAEEHLRGDPGRLLSELAAVPMFGGRTVVAVRGGEVLCRQIENLLDGDLPRGSGVLVAEIEALPAQWGLGERRRDERLAVIVEPVMTPQALVRELAAACRVVLEPEAVEVLIELTAADRGVLTSEIDKLASYAFGHDTPMDAQTVLAVCGDASLVTVDAMIGSALSGDLARLCAGLVRARDCGTTGHQVTTALAGKLFRDLRFSSNTGTTLAGRCSDILETQHATRLSPVFDQEIAERLLLRIAAGRAKLG